MMRKKKTTASRLKHRIILQQEVRTPDSQGGYTRNWQDVADLWAEIVPMTGNRSSAFLEKRNSDQLESITMYKILIRYRSDVSPDKRFIFNDRIFNIRSVINILEKNENMEIIVEEGSEG